MLAEFEYAAPRARSELLDLLAERGGDAKILAGGTDVLPNIRNGLASPRLLVDVKRIAGYSGITWSVSEGLLIRPAATINDLLRDGVACREYPLLEASGRDLASYQIRNRATVVGNIVNASPCSDMAPALLCLGARALIASRRGERVVPLREFFMGVKKTVLRPDEVLEALVVPASGARARGAYRKLKRIGGHDLGIVGVALMKKDGALRLGISSAAPTPLVVDGLAESDSPEVVVESALKAIKPISDLRCTKEYREFMVETFVRRLLEEVA
jgi:CO/xanthine dehydrogenase FAD-binding subunit